MSAGTQNQKTKKRIWELDFLRFFAMVLMFVCHYHFAILTMGTIFGIRSDHHFAYLVSVSQAYWAGSALREATRVLMVLFPLLSGVTSSFAKGLKLIKKGIKYLAIAYAITLVTFLLEYFSGMSGFLIQFGVIHMLASCMLIFGGLDILVRYVLAKIPKIANKYHNIIRAIFFAILGAIVIIIGFVAQFPIFVDWDSNLLAFVGILSSQTQFQTADYYPLVPWLGWFFVGVCLGILLYSPKKSLLPDISNNPLIKPCITLGQYAIQFYLIHQVALFAFFYIFFMIFA